jgi:hypothetical protein
MEASGSEALTHEIPSALAIDPGDVDGALAFDEADNLGDGICRRDRDHHVGVIAYRVPLLDPAFFLPSQSAKDITEMLAQLPGENLRHCFGTKTT